MISGARYQRVATYPVISSSVCRANPKSRIYSTGREDVIFSKRAQMMEEKRVLNVNSHPQLTVLVYCHIAWFEVLGKMVMHIKGRRIKSVYKYLNLNYVNVPSDGFSVR